MTAVLLHLSDAHFRQKDDLVLGRAELIAASIFPQLPAASAIFIVFSGDIAFSGQEAQYAAAKQFLRSIRETLRREKDIPVEFILSPGNHDCDFSGDQAVRDAVLKEIPKREEDMPPTFVQEATKVQSEYKRFWSELTSPDSLIYEDPLWAVQAFSIEGKRIWIDCINAAWMSSLREAQGSLVFPLKQYREFRSSDADLRIGVLHQPPNWLRQGNYQKFRTFVQSLEDIVFTGHEHEGNASVRIDAESGECAIIEGCALQDSYTGVSEFNVVLLDLAAQQFSCEKYSYVDGRYTAKGETEWFPMRPLPVRRGGEFQLVEKFARDLDDPGATLRHPIKQNLLLSDFYVYPDLDIPRKGRESKTRVGGLLTKTSARTLLDLESLGSGAILEGEESVGKTRLLFQLYSAYHQQGHLPLYIDARRIKSATSLEVSKLIRQAIKEQYVGPEEKFLQESGKRKILLIDDFDECPLNEGATEQFLTQVSVSFTVRMFTVSDSFDLAELFSADKLSQLSQYSHYVVLPFGFERRGELVRKWNALGQTELSTKNDWLHACEQAERLIEAAKLRHLASPVPILVLSLLQVSDSSSKELQSSSFAHYFYFLIVGALGQAGVPQKDLNRYLAFGTHLSWFVKSAAQEGTLTSDQFKDFCEGYSRDWTRTDAAEMLEVLCRARILNSEADMISFAYPYTYYYFLGRFLSQFLQDRDVLAYVDYCMEHLYVRECANTVLFLAHHASNSEVIDKAVGALNSHFTKKQPATLSKDDIRTVAALLSSAPKVAYKAADPVEKRRQVQQLQDELDDGDDGLAASPAPVGQGRGLVEELISLTKTIEVTGALLTSHFASFSRETKNNAVRALFTASLRVVADFFDYIGKDSARLIKEISARSEKRSSDLISSEAEIQARYAIAWIVRAVSAGWIMKAAQSINSPDLSDNVAQVVTEAGSNSFKLIQIAQQLDGPGRLPRGAVMQLLKTESDNPLVMSVLMLLILHRLYMYETHFEDKHWAISTFDLLGNQSRINAAERQQRLSNSASAKG